MESLLQLHPSHTLPDLPLPEFERIEACVSVYRTNEGSMSSTGSGGLLRLQLEIFGSLLISPIHLHDALHSFGQFLHSHKVVLLLHGLKKLRQLEKIEKKKKKN